MVRIAHTADLDAATLAAARVLLDEVFDGELTDDDWEHCLGGMHALGLRGRRRSSATRPSSSAGSSTTAGRCAPATSRAWREPATTAAAATPAR